MFSDRYTHDDSYSIVLLKADPRGMKADYHLSRIPLRSIISAYIGRKIGSLVAERYSKQAQEMYNFLLGNALTKSAAGWIFEGRVHACLRRGGGFDIRCLRTGDVPHITLKISEITFGNLKALSELMRYGKGIRNVNPQILNRYLRLERCSLASIDCLSVTSAEGNITPQVFFLHTTVGVEHPVKASGLKAVCEHLPVYAQIRPPWIVFVMPEGPNEFKVQSVTPVDEDHPEAAWMQYALTMSGAELWCLPEKTVLQKRSVSEPNYALQIPKSGLRR
ncbi:hypothetical protein BDD12DRAFT_333106 [Trichophaea hybrida]|nr:hypothetical protein BDD12DRAFT_333106 [Trichophaea hybrida]